MRTGEVRVSRPVCMLIALVCTANWAAAAPPISAPAEPAEVTPPAHAHRAGPVLFEPGPTVLSTLYADGAEIEVETETIWRYMCGSDTTGLTDADLTLLQQRAAVDFAPDAETWQISAEATRGGGFNIVFNVSGGLPAGAQAALDAAAAYLETQFADPITVTINMSMVPFGDTNVIGATSSTYASNVTWDNSRLGLINGMDADDVIQDWLPNTSTIPVRYVGSSTTVTNENRVFFTVANYRATIGTISGTAASMQFNTQFAFDYDPTNGVGGGSICFQSVVVHEVGHALGFVSGVDFRANDIEALDIYRFQAFADGTGDWNPDTYEEFQTMARTVDNNVPNDNATSDIISSSHRMSDGNPYQASHFREQVPNIGIMDPAFAFGQTFYPNFLRTSDLNMFDAIGWDYPPVAPCDAAQIVDQPAPTTSRCAGTNVTLRVSTTGTSPSYQWRRGTTNLTNDGHYSGVTTPNLTIFNLTPADTATNYNCVVTNDCTNITSNNAELIVLTAASIAADPTGASVCAGDEVVLTVTGGGSAPLSYQWRKNAGILDGETGATLTLTSVTGDDAGTYDVVVSNACGSQTSAAAVVEVAAETAITTQPQSSSACTGGSVTLSVEAGGSGTLAYQWRQDGAEIDGATSASYEINPVTPADFGDYDVLVTGDCGTVPSEIATLSPGSSGSGDLDCDGDVDLADFATLAVCFTGPDVTTPPAGCSAAEFAGSDIDGDGDVDLADFSSFAVFFGG